MGLDSTFIITGHVTMPERFAEDFAHEMYPSLLRGALGNLGPELCKHAEWDGQPVTVIMVTERFYGPGYERGRWPVIAGMLSLLGTLFPDSEIFYASDAAWSHVGTVADGGVEFAEHVTIEWLRDMWNYYVSFR